jgi:hypothetical protein
MNDAVLQELNTDPVDIMMNSIRDRLKSHAYFSDIPVLVERQKDLNYEVDKALGPLLAEGGGGGGVCVIILTPRFKVSYPNVPGPNFDDTQVKMRTSEDVLINRSEQGVKKPGSSIALMGARLLHLWIPAGTSRCLTCSGVEPFQDEALLIWDTNLKTELGLQPIVT